MSPNPDMGLNELNKITVISCSFAGIVGSIRDELIFYDNQIPHRKNYEGDFHFR